MGKSWIEQREWCWKCHAYKEPGVVTVGTNMAAHSKPSICTCDKKDEK